MEKKQSLIERFQQLAGIKPLYENALAQKLRDEAKHPDSKVGAAIFNKYAKKIENADKADYKKIIKAMESELISKHPDTFNGEDDIPGSFLSSSSSKEEMTAPDGWTEIKDLSDMHYSEEDGEIAVKAWDAPMEGWDEKNKDIIIIRKDDSGFYLDGYVPFGDFEMQGPFNTYEEVFKLAVEEMEAFKEDWDEQ